VEDFSEEDAPKVTKAPPAVSNHPPKKRDGEDHAAISTNPEINPNVNMNAPDHDRTVSVIQTKAHHFLKHTQFTVGLFELCMRGARPKDPKVAKICEMHRSLKRMCTEVQGWIDADAAAQKPPTVAPQPPAEIPQQMQPF
jgi:hypothetical protein